MLWEFWQRALIFSMLVYIEVKLCNVLFSKPYFNGFVMGSSLMGWGMGMVFSHLCFNFCFWIWVWMCHILKFLQNGTWLYFKFLGFKFSFSFVLICSLVLLVWCFVWFCLFVCLFVSKHVYSPWHVSNIF